MNTRRRSGDKPLLGEILLGRGLISKENLDQVLRVQAGGMRRVGYLLVKMKFISDVQLLDAISTQLGIPIVEVESEFRDEARGILPRHLCRRFTVLPLALEENHVVRLAMVDPLDDVAIREVENFTGLAVRPVLANVNDIRRGIERHVPLLAPGFFQSGSLQARREDQRDRGGGAAPRNGISDLPGNPAGEERDDIAGRKLGDLQKP